MLESVCPATGESCPLDVNLAILAERTSSPEAKAAIESIKTLVSLRRKASRCLDGPYTGTIEGEGETHCEISDISTLVKGAISIRDAFGPDEELVELTNLHKISERKNTQWRIKNTL